MKKQSKTKINENWQTKKNQANKKCQKITYVSCWKEICLSKLILVLGVVGIASGGWHCTSMNMKWFCECFPKFVSRDTSLVWVSFQWAIEWLYKRRSIRTETTRNENPSCNILELPCLWTVLTLMLFPSSSGDNTRVKNFNIFRLSQAFLSWTAVFCLCPKYEMELLVPLEDVLKNILDLKF
jgi:hypothetical protein